MRTAVWAYPWDLADEGIGSALALMRERAGADAVNVAAVYHAGKFLHVHNPRRRVVFPRSGTLYFEPRAGWHGELRIAPPVWEGAAGFWPEARREAERIGVGLTAWTLCLHNSGIGFAHPDCSVENAFGDRIPTDLCANNPDVRAYVVAMVADLAAQTGVDRVLLESLEYMPFRHGFHHEVIGVPTGPTVDFLMSLCFCEHCVAAGRASGADVAAVRRWTRGLLDEHFADPFGEAPQLDWTALRAAADGEFAGLLELRQTALASLLEEVREAVAAVSPARLAILDFGPLYPNGPDGRAWENGVDLARQLPLVDEVHPTFYFTDPEVHACKVEEYVAVVAGERPIVPALRAILPQTESQDGLRAQVAPLAAHASELSFYNYGFMALQTLDWIGRATDGALAR
jgi:hypothetical protein